MADSSASHHPKWEKLSPAIQEAFAWLGILAQDAIIRPSLVATLWAVPIESTYERLQRLRDAGLLQPIDEESYCLEEIIHDSARQLLLEQIPLPEAHAIFLTRYQDLTQDDLWHTLPDDGYIHQHLTWHMEQAGWEDEIHALLREETAEEGSGWFEAREALGQTAGYLADVAQAWWLAEAEWNIGLQCRYALITASINSLAGRLSPVLLAALIQERVWTPSQALAYVHQIPDPIKRAKALADLLPEAFSASDALGNWISLALVQKIENEWYRVEALAGMATHLSPALLEEAVEMVVNELGPKWYRVRALTALAPHLMEPRKTHVLEQALGLTRKIDIPQDRIKAFTGLAPHLSPALKAMVLDEALAAARVVKAVGIRYSLLTGLIPHLPEGLKEQALRGAWAAAKALPADSERARALVDLIPHAPEPLLLAEALTTTRSVEYPSDRAQLLAGLAPCLEETQKEEVLAEALREARQTEMLRAHYRKASALTTVAVHLSGPLREKVLEEALAAARETEDCSLPGVLEYLASHLPVPLLPEALTVAHQIRWPKLKAEALVRLLPHLPDPMRPQVLAGALAEAQTIGDEKHRTTAQDRLQTHLQPRPDDHDQETGQPEQLTMELTTALAIDHAHTREVQLADLASRLVTLSSSQLHCLWCEALPVLAARSRRNLLSDLRALAPVIVFLDGPDAAAETFRAIRDVGRWWP